MERIDVVAMQSSKWRVRGEAAFIRELALAFFSKLYFYWWSIEVGSAQTTISNSRLWAFDDLSLTEFGRTQMTRISSSGIGISTRHILMAITGSEIRKDEKLEEKLRSFLKTRSCLSWEDIHAHHHHDQKTKERTSG
ncbi:hypothetical protein KQX54_020766 [Cotesia glomerata]|uniref:Uncharacterized protein n=1 Tax=Cotesia glomerata TaxID=32391 RepID=A0AAV7I387_COTGL|nr:hypothetical protein KQX54_020766 [Cotesia glomerata]